MVDEQGLHFSPRKVTVSTSGLVPQLKRFLHESNCALAVSLNATTDEVKLLFLYCYGLVEHTYIHRNSHGKLRTVEGRLVTLKISNLLCQVRNWIMPINRKYKLDLLLETLREELCLKHNYKVLFEYVMLEGINDRLGNLLSLYFLHLIYSFAFFPFVTFVMCCQRKYYLLFENCIFFHTKRRKMECSEHDHMHNTYDDLVH